MDIVANGGAGAIPRGDYWTARELLGLIQRHPDLKDEAMRRYEAGRGWPVFEHMLADLGDADAVLALVRAYAAAGRGFDGLLQNAIREAALSKEPAADWAGAYELRPVPLPELRKTLFAMTEDASPATAALAEACLAAIDELRDEYGASEFEPRHPDVEFRPALAAGCRLMFGAAPEKTRRLSPRPNRAFRGVRRFLRFSPRRGPECA